MKKISTFIIASIVAWGVLLPTLLFAQERIGVSDITGGLNSGKKIIDTLNDTIVKSLAALLMSSALLVFFAGIVEYIWGKRQGDSGKVKTGNEFMTWGLVALFVMFSVLI
jgi:succinate dehydrogenase/fumarate reductase cytochrome b subunit